MKREIGEAAWVQPPVILGSDSPCPVSPTNTAQVTHHTEYFYFKSSARLVAADTDPLFLPIMAAARAKLWELVPWILSAVDVGLGGCFQARSILKAFAKTRGAPWLSESRLGHCPLHFLLASVHKSWAARAAASVYLAFPAKSSKVNGARVWAAGPSWKISQWEEMVQMEEQYWWSHPTVKFIPVQRFFFIISHTFGVLC